VQTKLLAAASFAALVALAGCSSGTSSTTSTTAASTTALPATTSTTKSAAAITAALLVAADVPGATSSPPSPDSSDVSACFPGNPLGSKTDPNEVKGPDLQLTEGGMQRNYGSSARQATPKEAADFIATFASPSGSACALNAFKTSITNDPKPPKVDASGLAGTVTTAAVGDGGAVLTLTGNLMSEGNMIPAAVDLLFFHKGSVVVAVSTATFGGPNLPGQAVELANKVNGRLS